jgi:ERCC4-type nuclease
MKGTVIIDTREQDLHILKKLETLDVRYIRRKLNFGDYSFEFNGQSYESKIVIERKGSLDEIIGNFTNGRERFKREFERSKGCKVILMVESSIEQLEAGNYRSRMNPKDLKSFLKTWSNKFQLELHFVEKGKACEFILERFRNYYLNQKGDPHEQSYFNGTADKGS